MCRTNFKYYWQAGSFIDILYKTLFAEYRVVVMMIIYWVLSQNVPAPLSISNRSSTDPSTRIQNLLLCGLIKLKHFGKVIL
jgi:hypothetical protein